MSFINNSKRIEDKKTVVKSIINQYNEWLPLSVAVSIFYAYKQDIVCYFESNNLFDSFIKQKNKTFYHFCFLKDNQHTLYIKIDQIKIKDFNIRDDYGKITSEYNSLSDFYNKVSYSVSKSKIGDVIISI